MLNMVKVFSNFSSHLVYTSKNHRIQEKSDYTLYMMNEQDVVLLQGQSVEWYIELLTGQYKR